MSIKDAQRVERAFYAARFNVLSIERENPSGRMAELAWEVRLNSSKEEMEQLRALLILSRQREQLEELGLDDEIERLTGLAQQTPSYLREGILNGAD